jgi:diacylglycerol O-acyltransferase / wax synthase
MRRLGISDAGWLFVEQPDRPMHVGGLLLFDPPPDAGPGFLRERLLDPAREYGVRSPFNQRLARPYGRAGIYHWVEDEAIDLDVHLRHLALPAPGRIRELLELVSADHSSLLDRHRPLWQVTLVEGLEDGRIAAYAKVHHSMLDGVAAMRQLLASFSRDPDEVDLAPPWARGAERRSSSERGGQGPLDAAFELARESLGEAASLLGLSRAVVDQVWRASRDTTDPLPFRAPRTMLDQPLTGARRYVAQSYELDRLRAVADAFGTTLNDVVLALCSGALRTYLDSQNALPDRPLIAMVPVAIRPADGEHEQGNALTLLLANLATDEPDPARRLELIKTSMDHGKARLRGLDRRALRDYGLLLAMPTLLGQLARVGGRVPPVHNLTISNVPGPSESLYWNGARLSGVYPISLLPDGDALNITQLSYAGNLELGITAARDRLPQIQRMIDYIEEALVELEKAAGA